METMIPENSIYHNYARQPKDGPTRQSHRRWNDSDSTLNGTAKSKPQRPTFLYITGDLQKPKLRVYRGNRRQPSKNGEQARKYSETLRRKPGATPDSTPVVKESQLGTQLSTQQRHWSTYKSRHHKKN